MPYSLVGGSEHELQPKHWFECLLKRICTQGLLPSALGHEHGQAAGALGARAASSQKSICKHDLDPSAYDFQQWEMMEGLGNDALHFQMSVLEQRERSCG